ncbi:MAG: glutathione S-transferase [Alphaproteobacteria bacterium]|nr:glutathione S-transferase [Alphaproteobacteria bacterium]
MIFYDCSTAPSPRRVRIFIAEKGMEIPTVQVNLRGGEHLEPAFRAKNPHCTVPVLELDDGTCLGDIVAIQRYLEEIQPDPPLLGRDAEEKAVVAMWDRYMEFDGFMAVAEALRNSAKGMVNRALTGPVNYAQIPELAERGRQRTRRFLADLDARLGESPYVAGPDYTVADITALVVVDFAGWIKEGIPAEAQNLRRWHENVSSRRSAQA